MTEGRISQDVVEIAEGGPSNARISQDVVEVAEGGPSRARLSQDVVEVAVAGSNARLSQLTVEMLIFTLDVFMPLVYPTLPGLGFSVHWRPKAWNMATFSSDTGSKVDLGYADSPTHEFELTYDFLRGQNFQRGSIEFKIFMGFWMNMLGNLGRFLFKNPDDYQVARQVIGTTDGVSHIYQLSRTFGIGEYSATELVGYVDTTEEFNVYLDGTLVSPSDYIDVKFYPVNQTIIFSSTPTIDQEITVDMSYFYYCRFTEDTMDFEKFMDNLWLIKTVKFESLRAGN